MNRFSDQKIKTLEIDTELPLTFHRTGAVVEGEAVVEGDTRSNGSKNWFLNRSETWAKKVVLKKLDTLQGGTIVIQHHREKIQLGDLDSDGLTANLKIADSAFYRRTLLGGMIGAAESYIDGQWGTDNLTDLIRIMIRNIDGVSKMERTWSQARTLLHRVKHARRKNTISGSRKNIQDHYDLGNEFYSLFLDPTMNYSAGIFDASAATDKFPNHESDLHGASLVKMDRICHKLDLKSTDHVIEIGTGWGGLAIFMATQYGCQVTTTTISKQQHQFACTAVAAAGVEDRVTVLLEDYRNLSGQFDKLVSVEMIEAVGHQFLDTYFAKCSQLLKPDGAMMIQAILIGQQNYRSYRKGVDFIRAYVFPGGCLPSAVTIHQSVGRSSSMRMLAYEDMTQHYADTLSHWRNGFMEHLPEVMALGFDDYFIRLWHFYLCYCEAAFAESRCQSAQLLFAKSGCAIDPVVGS